MFLESGNLFPKANTPKAPSPACWRAPAPPPSWEPSYGQTCKILVPLSRGEKNSLFQFAFPWESVRRAMKGLISIYLPVLSARTQEPILNHMVPSSSSDHLGSPPLPRISHKPHSLGKFHCHQKPAVSRKGSQPPILTQLVPGLRASPTPTSFPSGSMAA